MMNVIVLASCMFAAFNGGNSLMIHNIKAEGVMNLATTHRIVS